MPPYAQATHSQLHMFMDSPLWLERNAVVSEVQKEIGGGYPEIAAGSHQFVHIPDSSPVQRAAALPFYPKSRQLPPVAAIAHTRNAYSRRPVSHRWYSRPVKEVFVV